MNVAPVFYIVGFIGLCSCRNSPREKVSTGTDTNFVLDLTHPDTDRLFTVDSTYLNVNHKIYYSLTEESILSIVYGDEPVWEAGSGTRATVAHVYSRGGNASLVEVLVGPKAKFVPSFFAKNGASWKSITENEFSTKLNALYDSQNVQKSDTPITLDIAKPDKTKVFILDFGYGDLVNLQFASFVDNNIAKVVSGSETFWEAGSGKKGTLVDLLYKGGEPKFFALISDQNDESSGLFFERKNNKWVSVEMNYYYKQFDEYYKQVRGIRSLLSKKLIFPRISTSNDTNIAPDYENMTIDLLNPDRTNLFITNTHFGKADYYTFSSRIRESIAKVVYGDETVWEAGHGKNATTVHLISKYGKAYLAEVVTGRVERPVSSYHEREDNKWVQVDKDYYIKKSNTLFSGDVGFALDLDNVDKEKVSVLETDYNHLHNTIIWTKVGLFINEVVHQGRTVWESKDDHASSVNVLYEFGDAKLLKVLTGPNDNVELTFFEKRGGRWVPVDKEYYYKKHDELFDEQTKFGFAIDISRPNTSKVAIYEHNVNGVRHEHFIPKYDLHADRVVDNGTSLWVSESGSRVTGIVKYSSYGRSICRVNVVDAKNKLTQHYFLKKDGQWIPVDFSTFFDKVKDVVDTGAKNVRVDVLSSEKGPFNNLVYNDYGVETRSVSPLNGFKIISLHYGKELLWEGKDGEYCSSATFFEKDGVEIASVMVNDQEFFFKHTDGSWVGTDAKTFQDGYAKMMGVVPEPTKNVKVDVLSPQKGPFNNLVYNDYGVETRRVSPLGGSTISALYYGKELLWEGATGQYLSSATFFEKDDLHICSVMVNDQEFFFEQFDNSWFGVGEKQFSEVYAKMMGVVTPEPVKEVDGTLDITALPQETETYKPSEDSPYTFFVVSTGTPVTKVVDGPDTIWTGTNEQLCTASSFLSNGKKTLLAELTIGSGVEKEKKLYFEKMTFKWHQITEAFYDFKLEQLKVLVKDGFLTNSLYTITLFVAIVSGITLL